MSVLMVQQSALRFTPRPSRQRGQRSVRLEGPGGFRFTEVGTGKKRWDLFGASAVFQVAILMTLAWLPLLYIQSPPRLEYSLTVVPSRPFSEYVPPKRKPIVTRRAEAKPVEQPVVKPAPKFEARLEAPVARRREVRPVETPQLAAMVRTAEMDVNTRMQAARAPVETGVLKTPGSSEQPTIEGKRASEVQTGGFGDPNGVPAKGNPNKAANINRVGSFGLPPGYGYGNGTGGTRGARGVVGSAGFGNGVAKGDPNARGSSGRGGVQGTGFGDAAPSSGGAMQQAAASRPVKAERVPVEILQKPNPAYTEQARQKRIEGNVKLRVLFTASGELRVLGVLQGLGYGLDEAAVSAAQRIRFRPARENGRPVDEPAVVTIEFKLAY